MSIDPNLNVEVAASVYSVVRVKRHVSLRGSANVAQAARVAILPYLYGHTIIDPDVGVFDLTDDGPIVFVLKTTATHLAPAGQAHNDASLVIANAVRLAEAQCDRLESGLYPARVVGVQDEAVEVAVNIVTADTH